MNSAPIILCVLALTSLMLCGMMTLAWHQLGRQRHAATWAIAYGCAATQWGVTGLGSALTDVRLVAVGAFGVIASCVLLMIGARQRAGLVTRLRMLVPPAILVAFAVALLILIHQFAMRAALLTGIAAISLIVAARAVLPRDRPVRAAEAVFATMLIALALFMAVMGLIAVFNDTGGTMARDNPAFFFSFIIGFPPLYIATGVTAVLLIAGDVSALLQLMVTHDELTGVLNRRGIEEAAMRAIANAQRYGQRLAAVICDLDHFKALNDAHGHIAGDAALQDFADIVARRLRSGDLVGRLGGDEFAMVLINSDAREAGEVVERIRTAMDGMLSASFGVTDMRSGDKVLNDLVDRADRALYLSKKQGRNRITLDQAQG